MVLVATVLALLPARTPCAGLGPPVPRPRPILLLAPAILCSAARGRGTQLRLRGGAAAGPRSPGRGGIRTGAMRGGRQGDGQQGGGRTLTRKERRHKTAKAEERMVSEASRCASSVSGIRCRQRPMPPPAARAVPLPVAAAAVGEAQAGLVR